MRCDSFTQRQRSRDSAFQWQQREHIVAAGVDRVAATLADSRVDLRCEACEPSSHDVLIFR